MSTDWIGNEERTKAWQDKPVEWTRLKKADRDLLDAAVRVFLGLIRRSKSKPDIAKITEEVNKLLIARGYSREMPKSRFPDMGWMTGFAIHQVRSSINRLRAQNLVTHTSTSRYGKHGYMRVKGSPNAKLPARGFDGVIQMQAVRQGDGYSFSLEYYTEQALHSIWEEEGLLPRPRIIFIGYDRREDMDDRALRHAEIAAEMLTGFSTERVREMGVEAIAWNEDVCGMIPKWSPEQIEANSMRHELEAMAS